MSVKFDFQGKNFIVVGASAGIGKSTTLELAESGAKILAIGRNLNRLEELKNLNSSNIFTASLDVTVATQDDWKNIISVFTNEFGKIDGGVYSAGIATFTPLNSFDKEIAHKIFDTSFWGMVDFIRVAMKKKFSNENSSFVVMSSFAGNFGQNGLLAYSAAKAAVKNAVQTVAKEIIRNKHRINSVSPAMVQTDMIDVHSCKSEIISKYPLGISEVEDISAMILFLLSERARRITGQDFIIDSGYLLNV